ncbi:pirin family protein [Aeromicrobium alkaliterrae]|uniref:Pirin family protein n=1 Tax=Aeromicrobium alkaliterrae TaxID=302168 RepID=A0ABP4VUZ8_9ACTN
MTLGEGMTAETLLPREVPLGGIRGITVHRTLPHRSRPTIGAWCFADHFGPTDARMHVLPHPHIGLQTVTWPVAGQIRHRDNLGSDVVLKPGELNLMTSGAGVSHSEISDPSDPTPMSGVQLWVALPESRRHGAADFEHVPDLPTVEGRGWHGTLIVGDFAGLSSRARVYTPLVGVQITLDEPDVVLDLDPSFEHGVLALDGPVSVDGVPIEHRALQYLAPTSRVRLDGAGRTVLLLGGEPFAEKLVMWWNFIGRDHDEIVQARDDWMGQPVGGRYGRVDGHGEDFIPAPELPNVRLRPRVRLKL